MRLIRDVVIQSWDFRAGGCCNGCAFSIRRVHLVRRDFIKFLQNNSNCLVVLCIRRVDKTVIQIEQSKEKIMMKEKKIKPSLGFEPRTLRLLSACSNQLSYDGVIDICYILK